MKANNIHKKGLGRIIRRIMTRSIYYNKVAAVLLLISIGCLSGCTKNQSEQKQSPDTTSKTIDMSHQPLRVTFKLEPAVVHMDNDTLLTITISAPSEIDVDTPIIDDRLTGFVLSGEYSEGPTSSDGTKTIKHYARLTPTVSKEYRIAPMAIQYTDKSSSPAHNAWFATKPITFTVQQPFDGDPGTNVSGNVKPVWIAPAPREIALYISLALALCVILVLLSKLSRKAHEQIKLMRMSPKERALKELSDLLAKDLIKKEMIKEFYLQLTMIVRHYIERQHKVRAPEQTTEEFLLAVGQDSRFTPAIINKLKVFMQAADLVKFAAHKPSTDDIANATDTAKGYIDADASSSEDSSIR